MWIDEEPRITIDAEALVDVVHDGAIDQVDIEVTQLLMGYPLEEMGALAQIQEAKAFESAGYNFAAGFAQSDSPRRNHREPTRFGPSDGDDRWRTGFF